MSRREFHFSEGTSNKFWAIEVSGTTQKVHFGKVGTTGQAQTKEFASEAEAKKATDKLIAEKVKKGYAEVTDGTKSAGTPAPTVKAKKSDDAEEPKAKPAKGKKETVAEPEAEPTTPAPVPVAAGLTRTIALDADDLRAAEWPKKWQSRTRPEPRPFNRVACAEALAKVSKDKHGYWDHTWPTQLVPASMTGEEAYFWLLALTRTARAYYQNPIQPGELALALAKEPPKSKLTVEEAIGILTGSIREEKIIGLPLSFLVSPKDFVTLVQHDWVDKYGHNRLSQHLADGFTEYVLPYLSEAQFHELQYVVRPLVQPAVWSVGFPPICQLAGRLHLNEEVRNGLAAITDPAHYGAYPVLRALVLSLGKPEWVESEGRRWKIRLHEPAEVRQWLAITKFSGLDVIRDSILNVDTSYDYSSGSYHRLSAKDNAERLTAELARVKAPEAAPFMLELKLTSKAPSVARKWLDEQAGNAIAGLIPVAAGRGKLADAAVDYLREARKKGHEAFIRECLKSVPADVAASIQKHVVDFAEKEYAVLKEADLPPKVKDALAVKGKPFKPPEWAAAANLPPIILGDRKLSDEHVATVLGALKRSSLEDHDPIVPAIKEAAEEVSLDAFAWKLFQAWQSEGCPAKEKWAMGAVGLFGGDGCALKLTPLVRVWPGESQHQRAVFGLECLRTIGTDTALMQLNGIAQKLKFKGLKEKASQAMEAIAKVKGLSRSQLEDRVVPDCDLDERGSRVFDFGPRQFKFALGPEMKPMIKDADGKLKSDFPKPGAKDDADKANAAVAEWKLMKKQIKEVATLQSQRLEQAMVTGRRWPVADFETLLVKHPLMTNLVRLLLWGGYDAGGKLAATFRVTEDQSYADVKDNDFKLKGIETVGIVHPLHLTAEQQSVWGEQFSDYEIVPPFLQLGRRIVRPEPDELAASEITRFKGIAIPAPVMVYGLEKLGWVRGAGMDGGGFDEHSKPFAAFNVTAVVHYEGGVGYGFIDPNETLKFDTCYFVKGVRGPSGYEHKEKSVPLKDVDPVAISEVLTDLSALASKAK